MSKATQMASIMVFKNGKKDAKWIQALAGTGRTPDWVNDIYGFIEATVGEIAMATDSTIEEILEAAHQPMTIVHLM